MRSAYLVLLVASTAAAGPAYRTTILATRGSDEVVGAALVAALKTGTGTKLDACWTRAIDREVKVEVSAGRVTKVEPVGSFEESERECVLLELKGREVAAGKELVVVTLELRSWSRPDRISISVGGSEPLLKSGLPGGSVTIGEQQAVTKAPIKEVKLSIGAPSIEGELSADQLDRVIKTRAGLFRACYVRELERAPGLEGTLAMTFTVAPDGAVVSAKRSSSTLTAIAVESCVSSNLLRLKFPATGKGTTVGVPFTFTQWR